MTKRTVFVWATVYFLFSPFLGYGQHDYRSYHAEIINCEQLISERKFKEAIRKYDSLFNAYDFVFLKDYKVAAQLCAYTKDNQSGLRFIEAGILKGWSKKDLQKDKIFTTFREDEQWKNLLQDYDSLHEIYLSNIDLALRAQVREMLKKDQKKALGALFRIGQKSQDKYATKKFAPHSENQLTELNNILDEHGYPGEKLIGNDWWMSVILSHHNSMSLAYVSNDKLYSNLQPKLIEALQRGEISPHELAVIEDWKTAVLSGHNKSSYGFLGRIADKSNMDSVNLNRAELGLRSIELRNELLDIEEETGMNLQLPKDWQRGKIQITE